MSDKVINTYAITPPTDAKCDITFHPDIESNNFLNVDSMKLMTDFDYMQLIKSCYISTKNIMYLNLASISSESIFGYISSKLISVLKITHGDTR